MELQTLLQAIHTLSWEDLKRVQDEIDQRRQVVAQQGSSTIEPAEVDKAGAAAFDYDTWFAQVATLRQQLEEANQGTFPKIDVVGMLHDIRDGADE